MGLGRRESDPRGRREQKIGVSLSRGAEGGDSRGSSRGRGNERGRLRTLAARKRNRLKRGRVLVDAGRVGREGEGGSAMKMDLR